MSIIIEINITHCADRYLVHVNCDKTYDKLKLISYWIKRVDPDVFNEILTYSAVANRR